MALTRQQARPREQHELRRYLRDLRVSVDGRGTIQIPHGLAEEALDLWAELPHASVDNILWAVLRHVAGDPGTLRQKVEVRAKRNTELPHLEVQKIRLALDEAVPAGLGHSLAVERLLALILGVVHGTGD